MTNEEALAMALASLDFIAEHGERPGCRPLEVGFRHSAVSEREMRERLLEDIAAMAETAKAAAEKIRRA